MSGVDPEITLHQDGPFCYRVTMNYTSDTLDEMAHRVAKRIEDELTQQILARLGYVKVVRCRECCCYHQTHEDGTGICVRHGHGTAPDAYCAWGERKEEHE